MGVLYFGGLWLTLQRLQGSRRPAFLVMGSLAARLALMFLGLYFITGGAWARIGAYLLGFFVMRTIMIRAWGVTPPPVTENGNFHGTKS